MRRIAVSRSLASLGSAYFFPEMLVIWLLSVIIVRFDRREIEDIASIWAENWEVEIFIRSVGVLPSLPGNCRLAKDGATDILSMA